MEDNTRSYRTRVLRNLIFLDDFIKTCKDNVNEAINIPIEEKNKIKRMETEKGLYAQVVKLRRKDLKPIAENKKIMNLNSSFKVNLQDHSVDLILNLIGLN